MKSLLVLQHVDREGPEFFANLAEEFSFNLKICRVDLNDELPPIDEISGLLVLGGPMGLSDLEDPAYKWLSTEIGFIERAFYLKVPLIGVCLGAQLLAYVAGGRVEPLICAQTGLPLPEIGWAPITALEAQESESVLEEFDSPLGVLHWHSDRIVLPENATLLASSHRCREQFFRIGKAAYGLQFHAEVDGEKIKRWIREDLDFVLSSLGSEGQSLLIAQQSVWSNATQARRQNLLRALFRTLWPEQSPY